MKQKEEHLRQTCRSSICRTVFLPDLAWATVRRCVAQISLLPAWDRFANNVASSQWSLTTTVVGHLQFKVMQLVKRERERSEQNQLISLSAQIVIEAELDTYIAIEYLCSHLPDSKKTF